MATVNEVIERALLTFPAESVTVTVQFEYVPSGRVLKSILLLPTEDELSELLQLPPYVMSPASVELKMYLGVLSLVGVDTFVTLSSVGPVVSIIKELTGRALLVLLTLSVTLMVQLLWVPSASALKVIVLSPATEILSLLLLLQSPP